MTINSAQVAKAALVFNAFRSPMKAEIIRLLHQKKKMNGKALQKATGLRQENASKYLTAMYAVDLVIRTEKGKEVWYSLNYPKLDNVQSALHLLTVRNW